MNLNIRHAERSDKAVIAEIELEAFPIWAEACDYKSAGVATAAYLVDAAITDRLTWTAEADRVVVGFLAAREQDGFLHVREIDVRPAGKRGVSAGV
ncbi:hypothetical protein [Oryzifoliimicrobium ureilyticus]|uniref:hypothetical protein n=1 Tax=Oryzifoliimicrobium ureilyticus TaxID=3113724 RepID=UPI0030760F7E